LKIIEKRSVPGLAVLYLAQIGPDAQRRVEFVDTLEPEVAKTDKWVMMISTQVGCAVGCRMCDAGVSGFRGNLSAAEMLEQIRFIATQNPDLDISRHPKVKIHFARMGEPALNPAVLEALRLLAREFPNPGIIASVSTVAPKSPAVEPWFAELFQVKNEFFPAGRFQLQFSLHATDEETRQAIVPIRKWVLEEVADYGRRFVRPGDRKVTLNFAPGPNELLDAAKVARVFDPRKFLIKVTPVNPTLRARSSGAMHVWSQAPDAVRAFARGLEQRDFQVILSPSFPEEISAETSCGQLWSEKLKSAAQDSLRAQAREDASYVTVDSMAAKSEKWLRDLPARQRDMPLQPERAALLVVDMQEFFLDRGSPAYLPPGRAALLNTRRVVDAFRQAGRPVWFTVHAHADEAHDNNLMPRWWKQVCRADSPWARVIGVLEARPGEILRKTGYSAFSNAELEKGLRRQGVAQLVLSGVKTDLCVESTARAAFDLGLETFVLADATAAQSEERHVSALKALARGFSMVTSAGAIARLFSGAAPDSVVHRS